MATTPPHFSDLAHALLLSPSPHFAFRFYAAAVWEEEEEEGRVVSR